MFWTHVSEALLLLLVGLAALTDLACRKIPNRLVLTGLLLAPLLQVWGGAAWPLAALSGAACGLLLFLPLYLARGMAAGDVKLMAMVGSFSGPLMTLHIGLVTLALGGAMALAIVIAKRSRRRTLANLGLLLRPLLLRLLGVPLAPVLLAPGTSVGGMPYGLAIAAGTLLVLARRHGWLVW